MVIPKRLITAIAICSCSLMGFISNASADKVDDVINAGKVRC